MLKRLQKDSRNRRGYDFHITFSFPTAHLGRHKQYSASWIQNRNHKNPKGIVAACHSACASNIPIYGGKSYSSNKDAAPNHAWQSKQNSFDRLLEKQMNNSQDTAWSTDKPMLKFIWSWKGIVPFSVYITWYTTRPAQQTSNTVLAHLSLSPLISHHSRDTAIHSPYDINKNANA